MSTRGSIGFRIDGVDKLTYNHSDSYPSWLGVRILSQVQKLCAADLAPLRAKVRGIRMLSDSDVTEEIVRVTCEYHNPSVSAQSETDLYCLFREAQGDLVAYLNLGYMPDDHGFILDSLFCEWAYILNLDDNILEVYEGYQNIADPDNRFGQEFLLGDGQGEYAPCKLFLSLPLDSIQDITEDDFLKMMPGQEE